MFLCCGERQLELRDAWFVLSGRDYGFCARALVLYHRLVAREVAEPCKEVERQHGEMIVIAVHGQEMGASAFGAA